MMQVGANVRNGSIPVIRRITVRPDVQPIPIIEGTGGDSQARGRPILSARPLVQAPNVRKEDVIFLWLLAGYVVYHFGGLEALLWAITIIFLGLWFGGGRGGRGGSDRGGLDGM